MKRISYTHVTEFDSSALDYAYYNDQTHTLYLVPLHGSTVYQYDNVSVAHWRAMLTAPSAGRWWQAWRQQHAASNRIPEDEVVWDRYPVKATPARGLFPNSTPAVKTTTNQSAPAKQTYVMTVTVEAESLAEAVLKVAKDGVTISEVRTK